MNTNNNLVEILEQNMKNRQANAGQDRPPCDSTWLHIEDVYEPYRQEVMLILALATALPDGEAATTPWEMWYPYVQHLLDLFEDRDYEALAEEPIGIMPDGTIDEEGLMAILMTLTFIAPSDIFNSADNETKNFADDLYDSISYWKNNPNIVKHFRRLKIWEDQFGDDCHGKSLRQLRYHHLTTVRQDIEIMMTIAHVIKHAKSNTTEDEQYYRFTSLMELWADCDYDALRGQGLAVNTFGEIGYHGLLLLVGLLTDIEFRPPQLDSGHYVTAAQAGLLDDPRFSNFYYQFLKSRIRSWATPWVYSFRAEEPGQVVWRQQAIDRRR